MQQPQMVGYIHSPPVAGINQSNNHGHSAYFGQVRPLKYAQKTAKGLGSIQMAIGIICLVFNIIIIGVNSNTYGPYNRYNYGVFICGYGIWGGVMFFISGLLSMLSGRGTPQKCMIIATMVMDIIAACLTAVVLSLAIVDAFLAKSYYYYGNSYYYYYDGTYRTSTPYYKYVKEYETTVALAAIIAILALVEAVISIIGSAFCCGAVCCTGSNAMITTVPYVFTNQQMFPYYPGNVAPSGVAPLHCQPSVPASAPPYNSTPQNNSASYDNEAVRHDAIPQISGNSELPSYSPPGYQNLIWSQETK